MESGGLRQVEDAFGLPVSLRYVAFSGDVGVPEPESFSVWVVAGGGEICFLLDGAPDSNV